MNSVDKRAVNDFQSFYRLALRLLSFAGSYVIINNRYK